MFKNIVIIILSILVISLSFFIFTGRFCRCSPVQCPNSDLNIYKEYLT